MKYVWFNINDGSFSHSWTEQDYNDFVKGATIDKLEELREQGFKLIQYHCINDPMFELYNWMKIVTNTKQ